MTVSESPVEGFAIVPNWIIRDQSIPRNIIAVYVVLTSHADRHGSCFPSLDLIAAESGLSKSTVQRTLNEMKERGLVDWQHVKTPNGWRNTYVLSVYQGGGVWSPRPEGCGHSETTPVVTMTTEEYPVEEDPLEETLPLPLPSPEVSAPPVLDMFDEFWKAYPKKRDKAAARRAFKAALKKAKAHELIEAATIYAASRLGRDQQYTKFPATWLNAESWLDAVQVEAAGFDSGVPSEAAIQTLLEGCYLSELTQSTDEEKYHYWRVQRYNHLISHGVPSDMAREYAEFEMTP